MRTTRSKTMNKGTRTKGEVSKILKLNNKEWKEFEDEGLFEFVDRKKQLIDSKNFERLRVAASLKRELGVNIAGIDVILNMREKMTRMRTDMNSFLATVRKKFENQLHHNVKKLDEEK
jgi:MerR family transcriptional regulator/heat shock protein HspR